MTTASETRGHSAANPGLRGHSCGDNYPLLVMRVGNTFRVMNCRTGAESNSFRTYNEAASCLTGIRIRNMLHS
jgi:hypothetical protein